MRSDSKNLVALVLAAALFSIGMYAARGVSADAKQSHKFGEVDRQRLIGADQHPGDWMTIGRDFGKSHFSPLTQINQKTVSRLGLAWQYDTHTIRGLEATPVVVDGVM